MNKAQENIYDKIHCKLIGYDSEKSKAFIKINLNEQKIFREIGTRKLIEKDLLYKGSEFYLITYKTDDNKYQYAILPIENKREEKELIEFYKNLELD